MIVALYLFVQIALIIVLRKYTAIYFVQLLRAVTRSTGSAIWVYAVLTLPGVLLHEISHFFMAALLGLRTGSIEMLPHMNQAGSVEFGSVQVQKTDPIRMILVGIAPFISGVFALAYLSLQFSVISFSAQPYLYLLLSYLIICIVLHVIPSGKDLVYWPVLLLIVSFVMVVFPNLIDYQSVLTQISDSLFMPLYTLAIITLILFLLKKLTRRY